MSFRDEFRGTGKTYAQWSLEKTTQAGFRTNERLLSDLVTAFGATTQQQTDRLLKSGEASAAALASEFAYGTEKITEELRQGSQDVVEAIQSMCDYLGGELCEIRWAVERQTRVSRDILKVLLTSLDNQSRQYWEQGVQCYEATEFEMAKERFEKALDANRTNYFAYQFLGGIAFSEDNLRDAIRNFELEYKFAGVGYPKALALSHRAACHEKRGELEAAADVSNRAVEACPEVAKFRYDVARYSAMLGRAQQACGALKEAIERDWNYWRVVISDEDFDPVRPAVIMLLDKLRERERDKAKKAVAMLKQASEVAKSAGAENVPVTEADEIGARLELDNVYNYREVAADAWPAAKQSYTLAREAVAKSIDSLEDHINSPERHTSSSSFREHELNFGSGCALWFVLYVIIAGTLTVVVGAGAPPAGAEGLSRVPGVIWWGIIAASILTPLVPRIWNRCRYHLMVELPARRRQEDVEIRTRASAPKLAKLHEDLESIDLGLKAIPASQDAESSDA